MNNEDKSIDTSKLPEEEPFIRKEIDQHPQPAQPSKPLDPKYPAQDQDLYNDKEAEKTSKEEGLNQVNAPAGTDAFSNPTDQNSGSEKKN